MVSLPSSFQDGGDGGELSLQGFSKGLAIVLVVEVLFKPLDIASLVVA